MAKIGGSIWIEGTELHYVDVFGREWYMPGTYVRNITARAGSIWLGGSDQLIHFISQPGNQEFTVPSIVYQFGIPLTAVIGSIWMGAYAIGANNILSYIRYWDPTQRAMMGVTVQVAGVSTHTDAHQDSLHTDTPHTDVAHSDIPGGPHQDGHNDVPHQDHTDSSHSDTHSDVAHSDDHNDDQQSQISPCSSGWVQTSHADHQDGNLHQDLRGCHHDTHSDSHGDSHGDSHSDVSHKDQAAKNSHGDFTDTSHTNIAHVDTAHVDVAHSDAHQDTHTDTPHGDLPVYVGY